MSPYRLLAFGFVRLTLNLFRKISLTGGDEENRTPDPLRARQVLSQLSYTPIFSRVLPLSPTILF